MRAKVTAVILCMVLGVLTIGGFIGSFMIAHVGLTRDPVNSVKERAFEKIADAYALSLLDKMDRKNPEKGLSRYQDGNLIYAVAKTKSLSTDASEIKKSEIIYQSSDEFDLENYSYAMQGGEGFEYIYDLRTLYTVLTNAQYPYYYGEETENASEKEAYWVLYSVRDPLLSEGKCNDFFRQALALAEKAGRIMPFVIPLTIMCGVMTLLAFLFLLAAAGHRQDQKEIQLRMIDRVPFEIITIAVLTGIGIGLAFFMEMMNLAVYESGDPVYVCMILVILLVLCGLIALGWCMSLAVRIKAKKFWRYTVLYYLFRPFRALRGAIRENFSFAVRIMGLLGILSFLEFLVIASASDGMIMAIFLIYKVIEIPTLLWGAMQFDRIRKGTRRIASGEALHPIDTDGMYWEFRKEAEDINRIGEGIRHAVEEQLKSERLKTELITNVSHDIKTPLTSIINYVDLMQKEETDHPKLQEYMEVLARQSARLKTLIENLIEASKAATGNVELTLESCDFGILLSQAMGEFSDRMEEMHLDMIVDLKEEPLCVMADGRSLWRILENLLGNICKYAQPGTRVYISSQSTDREAEFVFRNISAAPLNISSEQLMERFTRGDSSRSTEGNGLGLSIAESLARLMGGSLEIFIDGDLFKAVLKLQRPE